MGLWKFLCTAVGFQRDDPGPQFAIDADAVDPAVFGLTSYEDPITPPARLSRREAIQVPAVKRARDMIAGTIGTLPLTLHDPARRESFSDLLDQPERHVAPSITYTRLVEDLLFEGIAWWRITEFADGWPHKVARLDPRSVDLRPDAKVYVRSDGSSQGTAWTWVPDHLLIRFESPNDPLLVAGARAIRTCLQLDTAAGRYASEPTPTGYFEPREGVDPFLVGPPEDDETDAEYAERRRAAVADLMTTWRDARNEGTTAYIPAALKYNPLQWSAVDLQLVEGRQHAVLEIARLTGIDPEDLGVSTTSRTYANTEDRRKDRIDFTLAGYMTAITGRLSMNDVTPRGLYAKYKLDAFLRSSTKERYEAYKVGLEVGALDEPEIRALEDRPGLPRRGSEANDAVTLAQMVQKVYLGVGTVLTADEARGLLNMAGANLGPNGPRAMPAIRPPAAISQEAAVQNTADESPYVFDDDPAPITLDAAPESRATFAADHATRTISGLAVPWGVTTVSRGVRWQFARGTLVYPTGGNLGRIKLLMAHDRASAVGRCVALEERDDGLHATFKVARGAEGDRALMLAEDGVWDGLSIGLGHGQFENRGGVNHAVSMPVDEISLTPMPAFGDARLTSVAAQADHPDTPTDTPDEGTPPVECPSCHTVHAAGTPCAPAPTTPPAPALVADQSPAAPQFQATQEQMNAMFAAWAGGLGAQQPQAVGALGIPTQPAAPAAEQRREVVPAGGPMFNQVHEELPYRFDTQGHQLIGSKHDFSTDLFAGLKGHDPKALQRCEAFLAAAFTGVAAGPQFDVDTADATALNPSIQRPDMYVDQLAYEYPIWEAINKGTLADITPFIVPKFNTSAGLVAAHVEGVEPTPGTFTATSQTITPTAVSGKVEITREVWDQGGNPQLSTLIWQQMVRAWFEALEAAAVTFLDSLSPTQITLTTAATDEDLEGEITQQLAMLQYIRGGNRFRDFFAQIDLYKALIGARDGDGRKLFPLLNPVNASGTTNGNFSDVMIGGLRARPAWALAATGTTAASSYLFNREGVHGWATVPRRLDFEYRVAYIDLAIWGYKALANTRLADVREVLYDPAA